MPLHTPNAPQDMIVVSSVFWFVNRKGIRITLESICFDFQVSQRVFLKSSKENRIEQSLRVRRDDFRKAFKAIVTGIVSAAAVILWYCIFSAFGRAATSHDLLHYGF